LFILCLDDFSPRNITEMAENCLHGTYRIHNGLQVGIFLAKKVFLSRYF
jgi:hypothetical protein